MSPEDWQAGWGIENLLFVKEHAAQLPPSARQFLQSFGWPRWIRFESERAEYAEWGYLNFQMSFEQLSRELVTFNKVVAWGDAYDEQLSSHCAQSPYCCGGLRSFWVGILVRGLRAERWNSAADPAIFLRDCQRVRRTASERTAVSGERCLEAVI